MWLKLLALISVCALLGSCTGGQESPSDAKHRLQEYITKSFAISSPDDRKVLLSYMTGDARERLLRWSDDQFKQAFIDSKRQFIKLAFKEEKPVGENQMSVTYELSYKDDGKGHNAKVTSKKLAQMVKEQGNWQISEVKNIKELVEFENEMSLP
jgi:hypothetical protein